MGIDYTTYVGPYAECHFEKGNRPDEEVILDEVEESITTFKGDYGPREFQIWYGNRYRPNKESRSFDFDNLSVQWTEITVPMIAAEIAEFLEQYRVGLEVLAKHYGAEKVKIKWGILHQIH